MHILRKFAKPISAFLVSAMVFMVVPHPAVYASMVGTDAVLAADVLDQDRATVIQALERQDVRDQLTALGVASDSIDSRVAAMTDAEVAQLADQIESLPAGGDALVIALIVLGVFLFVELVGITDFTPIGR